MGFCSSELIILFLHVSYRRSQWPRSLRRGSAPTRLLRLWVRILSGAWMCVFRESCVLSDKRSLRQSNHSSRGVQPTVVCRYVWSRNLKNEETVARVGPQRRKKIFQFANLMNRLLLSAVVLCFWLALWWRLMSKRQASYTFLIYFCGINK